MYEARMGGVAEDWSVIVESVSPKQKKNIVKRMVEIFELDKKETEQVLSNTPLILLDNLTFGMAARIKNYFQKLGAVVETTNHDMIKKNCSQIIWSEVPDLSFFLKDETAPSPRTAQPVKSPHDFESSFPPTKQVQGLDINKEHLVRPTVIDASQEEKIKNHQETTSPGIDNSWEQRARELSERLKKIQQDTNSSDKPAPSPAESTPKESTTPPESGTIKPVEFAKLPSQSSEAAPIMPSQQIRQTHEERQKLQQELEAEIKRKEVLQKECEELRSKISQLETHTRDIEKNLAQKTLALELTAKEKKETLPPEPMIKKEDHEKAIASKEEDLLALQARVQELSLHGSSLEKEVSEKNRSVENIQNEKVSLQKLKEELESKTALLETKLATAEKSLHTIQEELEVLRHREKNAVTQQDSSETQLNELRATLQSAKLEIHVAQSREKEQTAKVEMLENQLQEMQTAVNAARYEVQSLQKRETDLLARAEALERGMYDKDEGIKTRDAALKDLENKVTELMVRAQEFEKIQKEHATLAEERANIRAEYEAKIAEQTERFAKIEEEHRRYRSRLDRKTAAATRELGEWARSVDALRQGLQKLTVFLGSQSVETDSEKKPPLRSPLNRTPRQNGPAGPT